MLLVYYRKGDLRTVNSYTGIKLLEQTMNITEKVFAHRITHVQMRDAVCT